MSNTKTIEHQNVSVHKIKKGNIRGFKLEQIYEVDLSEPFYDYDLPIFNDALCTGYDLYPNQIIYHYRIWEPYNSKNELKKHVHHTPPQQEEIHGCLQ